MKYVKKMAFLVFSISVQMILADNVQFRGIGEFGFLSVLSHHIQFGKNGTNFNYVENGGQDVLFPVTRFSVEMDIGKKNTFILLYQPLTLETQVLLKNDVTIENYTFQDSTALKCLYAFPFYRLSYLRELLADNTRVKLAIRSNTSDSQCYNII